jgi:Protein of unknown function (DUF4230)
MRRGISIRGLTSAFTLSALVFVPFGLWSFGILPPGFANAAALPPSITVIQSMSELATSRVHISDFIDGENDHYKGRWTLHGEVILGVDLSNVTYIESHPDKREAVLSLPQPHLVSGKVDHERSEEVYVKAVAWVPLSSPQALRDDVWKHADRKIQRLGQEPDYMECAKVQAERVLQKLFKGIGWNVRFEWKTQKQIH